MGWASTSVTDRAHWPERTTVFEEPMTDTFSATAVLLAQAAEGDQRAWDALVEQHSRLLWAVARSYRERLVAADEGALDLPDEAAEPLDAGLILDERNAELWRAFRQLPERCQ